jgi:CO/xanthine dehydrogenase Mo-binding subunit
MALRPDVPAVHELGKVLVQWNALEGDVDAAFERADVIVERTYRTQHVEHAYMEPEAGVAWMEDDVVTIRASTQVIEHATRIADVLHLPQSSVRVIGAYMGGGFGGKEDMSVEPFLALATYVTRRPVRMLWTRQESLVGSGKRHPFVMHYKTGAKSDGTIVAQEVDIIGDAGAYPLLSGRVLMAGATLAAGPYRSPNVRVRSRAVLTNNVPTSAFRGFGAMQVVFGYESQINLIAERLGLDKDLVRLRNVLRPGDALPSGEVLPNSVMIPEAIASARARARTVAGPAEPVTLDIARGRGIACNMQPYGRVAWLKDHASAWLGFEADGTLVIRTGITDLGGGQAASCCVLASSVLGVPVSDISIHVGDSALNPRAGGTFATRQLYMSGNAILGASRSLRETLASVAGRALGCAPGQLLWVDGAVHSTSGAGAGMTLAQLVAEATASGVQTSILYRWDAPHGEYDVTTGKGVTHPDYTYGCHIAEVDVDRRTGLVNIVRYIACHDVGVQINPLRVRGQIQGGVAQGLGGAMREDWRLDGSYPVSNLFADYQIPTAIDVPDIEVIVLEGHDGIGPYGAKGIGEPPIGPVAAAVADAIADAVGVRPLRLPFSPEYILSLMEGGPDGNPYRAIATD